MVRIIEGDCREVLSTLPDGSVHCCLTSPPYWGLRSYLKDGDPRKAAEIGSERTIEEHLAVLVEMFRAVRRVLRDDGTLWINYGDVYDSGTRATRCPSAKGGKHGHWINPLIDRRTQAGIGAGQLVGLPWRLALALQADGWWLRQDNIWAKTAPMPESVNGWRWERCRRAVTHPRSAAAADRTARTMPDVEIGKGVGRAVWEDCPGCAKCRATGGMVLKRAAWRTTRAHEYVFMFAKSMDYFCDAQAALEPASGGAHGRGGGVNPKAAGDAEGAKQNASFSSAVRDVVAERNPRTVWTIGPDPCADAHFATWPRALARKIIAVATSQHGCCPACGAPWARVLAGGRAAGEVDVTGWDSGKGGHSVARRDAQRVEECGGKTSGQGAQSGQRRACAAVARARAELAEKLGRTLTEQEHDQPFARPATIGWRATCDCGVEETRPCVVLDPFAGTGRTGEVAEEDGRDSILLELNADYVRLARERTAQCGLLTRREGVCK